MLNLRIVALLTIACAARAESIDRVVLPSGVTAIIAELHTSPAVDVRVVVRAGPLHEGSRLGSGLSAVTQRAIAGGGYDALTTTQVHEAIARLGDRFSAETTVGHAAFALTTTSPNTGAALDLLAGLVTRPHLATDDIERARQVVDAAPSSASALLEELYRQHPARLPIAGLTPLRDEITPEVVRAYHAERYRAGNVVVLVCGNLNAGEVRKQIEKAFAACPLGGFTRIVPPIEPPPFTARHRTLVSPAVRQPQVSIAWRTEEPEHPNQPALAVLAGFLGGERGLVSRLLAERAEEVTVDNRAFADQPGYLLMSFSTTSERRAEVEQTLYKGLQAMAAGVPDAEAFAAARAGVLRDLAAQRGGVRGLGDDLLRWELATGDPAYGRRFAELVQAVTAGDLIRVLNRYILSREGDNGSCTVVVRPPNDVPADVRLTDTTSAPNPDALVTPQVVVFPKGLRLLVRAAPEMPLAAVHLVLGGGAGVEEPMQQGATALLARVLCRATEKRTVTDIDTLLTNGGMRLVSESGPHRLDIGITCFPRDVETVLGLLVDCLTTATLPPEEIERARRRLVQEMEGEDVNGARFLAEVRRIALPGHYAARDSRGGAEAITRLDRTALLAQWRRLAVGANAVLAVYGHIDAKAVETRVRALLAAHAALPEGALARPQGTPWGEPAPPLTVITQDAPTTALALAWRGPSLDDRPRDQAPMRVLSALLDGRINRLLAQTVPGVRLTMRDESYDRRGLWLVWGNIGAGQSDAAQQLVRDEVARCIAQLWLPEADRGALPDSELASAKSSCVTSWALDQEDQYQVAGDHARAVLLGIPPELDLALPERLQAVGRKDLLRVAQAWLAGEPVTVIARPRSAAPSSNPPPVAPNPPAGTP